MAGALAQCEQTAKANAEAAREKAATDWWMVGLTGGLLLVTGLQALLFLRQLSLMRGALKEAKTSADAAKISAEAVKALERPWLVIEPRGVPEEFGLEPGEGRLPDDAPASLMVGFEISNVGRSPAWVVSSGIGCIPTSLPASGTLAYPDRNDVELPSGTPMVPGKPFVANAATVSVSPEHRRNMLAGQGALMLYGIVTYADASGGEHDAGFSWVYQRASIATTWSPEEGYGDWAGWDQAEWIIMEGPKSYRRRT